MAKAGLRAAFAGLIGALLLAHPARADWTAFGGGPEHQFFTTEKLSAPLGVLWKHATSVYADKGNTSGPIISNGTVYFPSRSQVIAVDANTGELKWKAPQADVNDRTVPTISATPVTNGEFIYVPTVDNRVTAYKCDDGTVVWQFTTGAPVRSSPTMVDDMVVFGSDDDFVYGIDARTGDLRWKSNDGKGHDTRLSDNANGSPVYYGGSLYINSADMKMWSLDARSGRVIWMQRMTAPSIGISPVAFNGKIYMAAGATMYQFRPRGGVFRSYPLQQWVENDISSTPLITDNYWYFGDRNGFFHAVTSSGKQALDSDGQPWKIKLEGKPVAAPLMTADTIYVTTDRGFIYGIDPAKGKITWTYRTEAPRGIDPLLSYYPLRAPMAVSNGRLYVVGDDGTLTCLSSNAPDDEGPVITAPRPSRGAVMNGSPPIYVAAYLWDEGTGINPDTIELLVDGQPIDQDKRAYNDRTSSERTGWVYDPVKRLITYQTQKGKEGAAELPLRDGRHKVTVQAADWRGNFNSLEWSFVVDNTLPRGAVAVKPTKASKNAAAGGAAGAYPGGPMGPGQPGQPGYGQNGYGQQGNVYRGGNLGGYTYQNRGYGGYNRGGYGGGYGGGGYGGRGGGGYGGGGFGRRGY
jgi:outer membrane protein assembly factor BamB